MFQIKPMLLSNVLEITPSQQREKRLNKVDKRSIFYDFLQIKLNLMLLNIMVKPHQNISLGIHLVVYLAYMCYFINRHYLIITASPAHHYGGAMVSF